MDKELSKEEITCDIEGYEGLYKVSNFGKIISYAKTWIGGKGSVGHHSEIELCLSNCKGYKVVGLRKNGVLTMHKVHRLVAKAFIPNPENKPLINHKDGKKSNNHIDNLEWATSFENMRHASKNGLRNFVSGAKHGGSKLKESDVIEILKSNLSDVELSEKYNVVRSTIYHIKIGKKWKYLTSQETN